jgi:hypothetical protein
MSPWLLDLILSGLFIYERADGSTYTSHDYKLRDYGVKCVGRTGRMSEEDIKALLDELSA